MRTLNVTGVDKKAVQQALKPVDPKAVKCVVNGATVAVWTGTTVKR